MLTLPNFQPAALALALLSASSSAEPPVPRLARAGDDPIVNIKTDDPKMTAAIAAARRTLPQFLTLLAAPPAGVGEFSFKYPLAGSEHIWVDHVERRGDRLSGRLANVPMAAGYRQGQRVTVPIGEVSDWAYRDAQGVMQGHRTTRVMLPYLDPAERRAIRQAMGWSARRRAVAARPGDHARDHD